MNLSQPGTGTAIDLRSRLPLKITGIVFWGMMLVGLLFSLIQLRGLDDQVMGRFAMNADRFVVDVLEQFERNPGRSVDESEDLFRALLVEHEFSGVVLRTRDGLYRFGTTPAGEHYKESAILEQPLASNTHALVSVLFYQTNLQALMDAKRKELLVTMGALSLIFGFILQLILQRVLTYPFLSMVRTAESFSRGATDARFDERRHDEFGFLGKFFDKALSYLLQQQEELRDALNRVRESETALYQEKERAEVTLYSIGDAVITTDKSCCIEY